MANPEQPTLAYAEFRFLWNGQNVENRMHFVDTTGVYTFTRADALATLLAARVSVDWLPLMAATCSFREVYVEQYGGNSSVTATAAGGNEPGEAAGESLPGSNTLCLSLRTGLAGRSRRGRFYTIGMTEGHQAAGVVTAPYRTGWLAAMSSLLAAAATNDFEPVVTSLVSNGVPRGAPLSTAIQSVILVDDYVDSQRRRLQGRGH